MDNNASSHCIPEPCSNSRTEEEDGPVASSRLHINLSNFRHSESTWVGRTRYQAHVTFLPDEAYALDYIKCLTAHKRWQDCRYVSYAYRVVKQRSHLQEQVVTEEYEDGGDTGTGEKLLYLLQTWDAMNVMLITTRYGSTSPGRLGSKRFKTILECAKDILFRCYGEQSNQEPLDAPSNKSKTFPNDNLQAAKSNPATIPDVKTGMKMALDWTNLPPPETKATPSSSTLEVSSAANQSFVRSQPIKTFLLTKADLDILKSIRQPPVQLHALMQCVATVIGREDKSWQGCKDMICDSSFMKKLQAVKRHQISAPDLEKIAEILRPRAMHDPERMRRVSSAGTKLLSWLLDLVPLADC